MYYENKLETLRDLFGTNDVALERGTLRVGSSRYPIIDDVIILLEPAQYTDKVRSRTSDSFAEAALQDLPEYAEDVQFSFGSEWEAYDGILPEHEIEFAQYFDLIDFESLGDKRLCDLGCGIGRWSWFLRDRCRELVLVDFSDAIFTARANLKETRNCLFFMGDLKRLPLRDHFADFLFSLGVLHHLPTPCLDETRKLKRYSPCLLIFLYYALDNRPFYFRWILAGATIIRRGVNRVRSAAFRKAFSLLVTWLVYVPFILLGRALQVLFGAGSAVPLYDGYHDKSPRRIEQDVYDRFFTRIEQRVTRDEIEALSDTFRTVRISDGLPYWHFFVET